MIRIHTAMEVRINKSISGIVYSLMLPFLEGSTPKDCKTKIEHLSGYWPKIEKRLWTNKYGSHRLIKKGGRRQKEE